MSAAFANLALKIQQILEAISREDGDALQATDFHVVMHPFEKDLTLDVLRPAELDRSLYAAFRRANDRFVALCEQVEAGALITEDWRGHEMAPKAGPRLNFNTDGAGLDGSWPQIEATVEAVHRKVMAPRTQTGELGVVIPFGKIREGSQRGVAQGS